MYLGRNYYFNNKATDFLFYLNFLQIPRGREEKGRLPNAAIKFYNATPKIFDKMGPPRGEAASLLHNDCDVDELMLHVVTSFQQLHD